jgi:hypothetical protein
VYKLAASVSVNPSPIEAKEHSFDENSVASFERLSANKTKFKFGNVNLDLL